MKKVILAVAVFVMLVGVAGAVTALSVIANQTNPQIGYITATTTNGTLGRSANMRGNNSTSNYLSYSAEL